MNRSWIAVLRRNMRFGVVAALFAGFGSAVQALPGPELAPAPDRIINPQGLSVSRVLMGQASDGRAVVVFTSGQRLDQQRLFVQRLSASGLADGPPVALISVSNTELLRPVLSVGPNGHYAVAAQIGLAQDARLYLRRFAPDGTEMPQQYGPNDSPLSRVGVPSCVADPEFVAFNSPAVAIDGAGNLAYSYARSAFCPTGPNGALQPSQTRLYYRYAPATGVSSEPQLVFEQSPVDTRGFQNIDEVLSSISQQDSGDVLMGWSGHPASNPNQTSRLYLRTANGSSLTGSATDIAPGDNFGRAPPPLIGRKSGGYVVVAGTLVQGRGLDGGLQFESSTDVSGSLIVQADGRFDVVGNVGRRYDANGVELGSYSFGTRPNRYLDQIPVFAPTLASGDYLAIYSLENNDGVYSLLQALRFGGPDGTPRLAMELTPADTLTVDDGRSVSLHWRSNAPPDSCFGFGNLGGRFVSSGSRVLGSFNTAGERRYGLTCGPEELTKSVTLTIVDPNAPTVQLSVNPQQVHQGEGATFSWSSRNADSCTAEGQGEYTFNNAVATTGSYQQTYQQQGTQTLTLNCTRAGAATATATASLTITPPQPTVGVRFSPESILTGQSSTLSYTSTDAQGCEGTITGEHAGTYPFETSGSDTLTYQQPGEVLFTLTCSGAGGSASASARLMVTAPQPTVTAIWTPASILVGESSTLSYASQDAQSCEASLTGEFESAGPAETSGSFSRSFNQPGEVVFSYSCTGVGGTATTRTTLTVTAPPLSVETSWLPDHIGAGEASTIRYSSQNAQSCQATLEGEQRAAGPVEPSGSARFTFSQPGEQVFTFTCTAFGRSATAQARLTVTAEAPAVTAIWTPSAIQIGESATVNFASQRAQSCQGTLTGEHAGAGPVETNGSLSNTFNQPGDVVFTYSCTGVGGTSTTRTTLSVTAPAVTVSASWSPTVIEAGQSATLSYSSQNAQTCTVQISGPTSVGGAVETTGTFSYTFTQAGNELASFSCTGPGGTVSTTASLTVNAAPTPPPAPLVIQLADGRSVQLSTSGGTLVNARTVGTPANLPAGLMPITDFMGFDIAGIENGAQVEVTMTLPMGLAPTAFIKCTSTCARYNGVVISGNRVRLTLTDGGAGDADGQANGVIQDPGAPAIIVAVPGSPKPPDRLQGIGGGGGALGAPLLWCLSALAMWRQHRRRISRQLVLFSGAARHIEPRPNTAGVRRQSRTFLVLALMLIGLAACGETDHAAPAARAASSSAAKQATAGRIDITVSGDTVERNSRGDADSVQCQLHFTATNHSAIDIKSLIVNYDIWPLTGDEAIRSGGQLVIPVAIKAGATGAPFGSEPVDDVRCDALKLRFGPQPGYQCRTEAKAPCAAFHYQGDGIAIEATP